MCIYLSFQMFLRRRVKHKHIILILGSICVIFVSSSIYRNYYKWNTFQIETSNSDFSKTSNITWSIRSMSDHISFRNSNNSITMHIRNENKTFSSDKSNEKENKPKIILYYNAPQHMKGYNGDHVFKQCKTSTCTYASDNQQLDESAAVIFNHGNLPANTPPKKRGQVWIFTSSESPANTHQAVKQAQWKGKFNWTMSYRRHSDFYFGYGDIIPRPQPIKRDYSKIYDKKDKDVAWIVSHCSTISRREEYAQEMKKYIDTDIYGHCGTKNCEIYKGNENDTCHDVISSRYKFYLSFENTVCKDYTTEKFYFPFAFDKPIISVAYGAYNMKDYVPADSYIDAADFPSAKELARYLSRIAPNKSEYIRLLKLKDKYISKSSPQTFVESMCSICEAIHSNPPMKIVNINEVMFDNQCKHYKEVFDRKNAENFVGLNAMGKIVSNLKDMLHA